MRGGCWRKVREMEGIVEAAMVVLYPRSSLPLSSTTYIFARAYTALNTL